MGWALGKGPRAKMVCTCAPQRGLQVAGRSQGMYSVVLGACGLGVSRDMRAASSKLNTRALNPQMKLPVKLQHWLQDSMGLQA